MALDPLQELIGTLGRPQAPAPRRRSAAAPTRRTGGRGYTPRTLQYQRPPIVSQETPDAGGFGGALKDLGGFAGKGLLQVLDVVDTPRAFVAAGLKDILDENDSVDLGQIWDDAMRNIRFNEATGLDDSDMPGWLKATAGFAGDVATDPLTYTGVGLVSRASKAGGLDNASNAIVSAAKHGSRKELAEAVAVESTRASLDDLGDAGTRVVQELVRNAGQKGRAAFTRRGLRQIGVDENTVNEVVRRIGADLDFRYGLRVSMGGRTVGSGAGITTPLAEGITNIKGALTKQLFGNRVASSLRPWMMSSRSNYNQIANQLLSGNADDPVKAALDLARIEAARGFSRKFVDSHTRQQADLFGRELRKLSGAERAALRDELEMALVDPMAKPVTDLGRKMRDTFDGLFNDVKNNFDDTLDYRRGYLPHFLTPEGKRWAANNPEKYKLILGKTDSPSTFQKARQIVAGRKIGNATLQEGTIREINDVAAREIPELGGAKLLVDDPVKLLAHYTEQAGTVAYERALLDMAAKYKMGVEIPLVATRSAVAPEQAEIILKQAGDAGDAARTAENVAGEATKEAVARRQAGLGDVRAALQEEVDLSASIVGQAEREMADVSQETAKAAADVAAAHAAVADAAGTKIRLRAAMPRAKRQWRDKWKRVIRENEQVIEAIKKHDPDWENSIRVKAARQAIDDAQRRLDELSPAEQALEVATRDHERAENIFAQATTAHADAKNRLAWLQADLPSVRAQHAKIVAAFEEANFPKIRGNSPKVWKDYNDAVRERVSSVNRLLQDPTFDGNGFIDLLRRREAQASEFDMLALKQRRVANVNRDVEQAFKDQLFYDEMVRQLDEGFLRYSDTYQLPQEVRDRLAYEVKSVQEKLATKPEIIQAVGVAYDKMLQLWKQYAVATPGFVSRNLYGGLFNMFVLDDVDIRSVTDFTLMYRAYHNQSASRAWEDVATDAILNRANPTSVIWRREARQAGVDPRTYVRQHIDTRFQESLTAAASTGFGQVPAELGGVPTLAAGSWNPLSAQFRPTNQVRKASEYVEAVMRGSHAYDVIRKGGTVENAISRVTKFHFNYQDIGAIDQAAKRVIPFWTFWSRNLPLQAQMWMRSPQKINRTIINASANIEALSDPDQNTPDYFAELGMTRMPFQTEDGGHMYGALDLPTMRLPDDVNRLNLMENPIGPLADAAPWFKLPAELAFNKNSFYNQEFKNELYESNQQGGYRVREAPLPLDLPIVRNIADAIPGVDFVGNDLAITDKTEHVLNQVPVMRFQDILAPEKRDEASATARRISMLFGVQFRPNTKEMQERKAYYEQLDERDKARIEAILRELGA